MSYEIDSVNEVQCPCGEGIIRQTIESNDWNQIKERLEILCDKCKEKYEIVGEYFYSKPKHDYVIYYCMNRKNGEKTRIF